MKKLFLLSAPFVFAAAACASAQETKPINVSLFPPAQIFKEDVSISGFRLNILYGKNADMTGLDFGIANWSTGEFKGIGWGWLLNSVEGTATGWQSALVNLTAGDVFGLQSGFYNGAGGGKGLMFGWINVSESFEGLQIAFVNYTKDYNGIQIGLVNIITGKEKLEFLPIVNWNFG